MLMLMENNPLDNSANKLLMADWKISNAIQKIGSFVAFVFWIALEIFQSAISSLFALLSNGLFSISINMSEDGLVYDLDTAIPYLLAAMALNLIFAGVCYGVTTYLTDKKMSV